MRNVEGTPAGCVDWDDQRRLHSSRGYLTPAESKQAHYAALKREPSRTGAAENLGRFSGRARVCSRCVDRTPCSREPPPP